MVYYFDVPVRTYSRYKYAVRADNLPDAVRRFDANHDDYEVIDEEWDEVEVEWEQRVLSGVASFCPSTVRNAHTQPDTDQAARVRERVSEEDIKFIGEHMPRWAGSYWIVPSKLVEPASCRLEKEGGDETN